MDIDGLLGGRTAWKASLLHIAILSICMSVVVCPSQAYNSVKPGRHVCMTRRAAQTPVKTVQTYYKPVYKKHRHMCDNSHFRLCTSFRVRYELAYRDVYSMPPQAQNVYACCPGWTQYRAPQSGCMQPLCSPPCQHGGRCFRPSHCKCPSGWTGPNCAQDVDECRIGSHGCEHACVNTPGRYKCECHNGFTPITADPHRCTLCLMCLPQYRELSGNMKDLFFRVQTLEKEKTEMKQGLAVLESTQRDQFETVKTMVQYLITEQLVISGTIASATNTTMASTSLPVTLATTPTHEPKQLKEPEKVKAKDNHVMESIKSLTRQIAFLEERLGLCECNRQ